MSINEKQKVFAEYYAASHNATEAAKKAGYSEKTARSQGQRLLTKDDVKEYLRDITKTALNERVATAEEVLEYLSETLRDKTEARRERTKAAELLGKRYRLFENLPESSGGNSGVNVNHVKADLSDKQLKELLENE